MKESSDTSRAQRGFRGLGVGRFPSNGAVAPVWARRNGASAVSVLAAWSTSACASSGRRRNGASAVSVLAARCPAVARLW